MPDDREHEAAIRTFSTVAAVVLGVAIVGISYAGVRIDRRWTKVVDMLVGPKERVQRVRTGYVTKRQNVNEVGEVTGYTVGQLSKAARAKARG